MLLANAAFVVQYCIHFLFKDLNATAWPRLNVVDQIHKLVAYLFDVSAGSCLELKIHIRFYLWVMYDYH
jgi:hypothetical protein